MKLKSLSFPHRDAEFWVSVGLVSVVVVIFVSAFTLYNQGILKFDTPAELTGAERLTELERRLDSVESQLATEKLANSLSKITGASKRAECGKAVMSFAADNKPVPESISRECVIPWEELNKDTTPQTTQEQADEFMAKVLPTMAALAPKAKKAACEMFIQSYQQENLKTPPAMNAECGL
ncbi:hypothetical protein ABH908_000242 [Pseudomonas frederiksbergensis]|uniref:hypothetical protein n=1 Tax=Pseudomonas TaxID=286 RepID=UPI003D1A7B94